jgi:hypothetical protein
VLDFWYSLQLAVIFGVDGFCCHRSTCLTPHTVQLRVGSVLTIYCNSGQGLEVFVVIQVWLKEKKVSKR